MGHEFVASATNVVHRGSWCPTCAGNAPITTDRLEAIVGSTGSSLAPGRRPAGRAARVEILCPHGHRTTRLAQAITGAGHACPECRAIERRRGWLERVRTSARADGVEVMADTWTGSRARLPLECRCGHTFTRRADRAGAPGGARCPVCRDAPPDPEGPGVDPSTTAPSGTGAPAARGPERHFLDLPKSAPKIDRHRALVRFAREAHGGELLEARYASAQVPHEWRCRHGHRFRARPANVIHKGSWCPECAGNAPLTLERFDAYARALGGVLLPGQHLVGNDTRLGFRCARGHVFHLHPRTLGDRLDGWCARCALIEARTREHAELVAAARAAGYRVLTPRLEHRKQLVDFVCPAGHAWSCRSHDFRAGTRCGECFRAAAIETRRPGRRRRGGAGRFT